MKLMLEVNGKINGRPFGIREPNEGEGPRSNRYSGSSVATVLSDPRWLRMLKRVLFNHASPKKVPPDQLSVQIPGKLISASLLGDTFIVSLIMVNVSILMEKEITSMVWKDSGVT
jgi:hypothetical protein